MIIHKYTGGKKKVCQEHDSIEKEIIVLGHSYWGKLSSYQCYTPFCPAKKLRILLLKVLKVLKDTPSKNAAVK